MASRMFQIGRIAARDLPDDLSFALDTAGSWEGEFPDPDTGDYLVTLGAYDRDEERVLVSRRYTSAVDAQQAAKLAFGAFAERSGYATDDDGELLPITVGNESGVPAWVVRVDVVHGKARPWKDEPANAPRGVVLSVLRDASVGDCTNGGISGDHDRLWLTGSNIPKEQTQPPGVPEVVLDHVQVGAKKHWYLRPVESPAGTVGPMFGGNYASASGGSRRGILERPLPIHDRFETPEQYRILST